MRRRFPAPLRHRSRVGLFPRAGPLLLAAALGPAFAAKADEPPPKAWVAGAYSFSDELGGFRITGISGIGTRDRPVVIRQEFSSASPATLVIRALGPVRPFGRPGLTPNGFIHLRAQTRNASGLAWIEFEFELQERRGQPSVFGDGLSFDQRKAEPGAVSSDSFARHSLDFEPHDRLLFRAGKVDPGETAGFGFLITDFTPRATFYLVEDPRIPSS